MRQRPSIRWGVHGGKVTYMEEGSRNEWDGLIAQTVILEWEKMETFANGTIHEGTGYQL